MTLIMPTKLKPIGDRVLITPDASKTESNGIILPFAAVKKSNRGVIVAIGDSCDPILEVGMHVIYGYHAGTQIEEGLIVRDTDIFAIL